MKRTILLLLTVIFLSACSNDNLELQEQEVNNNSNGVSAEENQSEENSTANSINNESENEETENDNSTDDSVERMTRQFIKDMYVESSLNDFRNIDEIVSEDFKERIDNQFIGNESENDPSDIENRTDKVEIYKNTSNRTDEYMYIIELDVINHDMEDIHKSERIGVISMIEESDTLKIDDVEEISNTEINE